jgi:lipopolysaccharide export system protein LptA
MAPRLTYPAYLIFFLAVFLASMPVRVRAQDEQVIEILHSEYMEYDKNLGTGVVKYVGKVAFKQEEVLMYCDSAYFFTNENRVQAYDNIHIIQGDTLHLYGDLLNYYGDNKMAEFRKNVTLIDKETTLTTEFLDFDLENNIGYYERHGHVINGDNTLDSRKGYYYSESKNLNFIDSVVIVNPDYDIYADTLLYHTDTEVAHFLGPTQIISPDNYIYCENGWYDTKNNISQFNENAYLVSDGQILSGDSLYYERDSGLGLAYDNVQLYDSAQDIILRGKYAKYIEEPEFALLTDSAVFIQISEEDSLFLHSDTLRSILDTTGQFKIITTWYKVKFYRADIQGKCDSLVYIESDSVFHLFGDPVLWSEEHQLTAEQMNIHMANDEPDYLEMTNSAFIISQDNSTQYNQIHGRTMTGHFSESQLNRVEVEGNGQSIYFARDSIDLIGINKGISSNIRMILLDGQIARIIMLDSPSAILHPPDQLNQEDMYLSGFLWLDHHRPRRKEDIFNWEGQ